MNIYDEILDGDGLQMIWESMNNKVYNENRYEKVDKIKSDKLSINYWDGDHIIVSLSTRGILKYEDNNKIDNVVESTSGGKYALNRRTGNIGSYKGFDNYYEMDKDVSDFTIKPQYLNQRTDINDSRMSIPLIKDINLELNKIGYLIAPIEIEASNAITFNVLPKGVDIDIMSYSKSEVNYGSSNPRYSRNGVRISN